MTKLMKYEFIKSRLSIFVLLIALGVAELFFLIGFKNGLDDMTSISAFALFLIAVFGTLILAIIGINMYVKDFRGKYGYLTYMAPLNTFEIIGAKLLVILLAGLAFAAACFAFAYVDFSMIVDESGVQIFSEMSFYLKALGIKVGDGVLFSFDFLLSIFSFISLGYLACSLTNLFFRNSDKKNVITFFIFLALYIAVMFVEVKIIGVKDLISISIDTTDTTGLSTIRQAPNIDALRCVVSKQSVFRICESIACFGLSGYLLKKKIDL